MDLELKKNPGPTFIQLKSNKQSLFHDIKKINNKIAAAANNHFFLCPCIEQNLIATKIQSKNPCLDFISVTVVT